jgi:large subunit ribosomal protein L11
MIIKLLIEGGDMKPGPAIAQQLGPAGINIGKVISDVNNATKNFKGVKVPIEVHVEEKTKTFTIKTFSPPTSDLIKKELNLEKGSNDHKNITVGNAAIEDIIKVALIKFPNMLEKDLKSAVKSVLGTAKSMGILVENKDPLEIIQLVDSKQYDTEILKEKTESSTEKREKLKTYLDEIVKAQNIKLELAKKAAEQAEQAKSASLAQVGAPALGVTATKEGPASTLATSATQAHAKSGAEEVKPKAKTQEKKK